MSKKDEALKLAQDLRTLADRFSDGWHDGIKIDASDIMLLTDAAATLAEQPAPATELREQEPVAHCEGGPEFCSVCHKELNPSPAIYPEEAYEMGLEEIAYYTSPPAQQEPVAWGIVASNTGRICQVELDADEVEGHNPKHIVPLYTSPPPQRKPLTDEEIWKFWCSRPEVPYGEDDSMEAEFVAAVRRVLAALGIKENT